MTDEDRLKSKLAVMGADAVRIEPLGRVLSETEDYGLMGAVLNELDETVLGRQLVFKNEQQLEIALDVANRRVLGLSTISDNPEFNKFRDLMNDSFAEDESSKAERLGELLRKFLASSTKLHVSAHNLEREVKAGEIGYSVETLAGVWGVGLYGAKPALEPDRLDAFLGYCQDIAHTWIRNTDGSIDTSDPSEDLTKLQDRYDALLVLKDNALNGVFNQKQTEYCLVLGPHKQNAAAVFLQTGSSLLLCIVPEGQLGGILSGWRESV